MMCYSEKKSLEVLFDDTKALEDDELYEESTRERASDEVTLDRPDWAAPSVDDDVNDTFSKTFALSEKGNDIDIWRFRKDKMLNSSGSPAIKAVDSIYSSNDSVQLFLIGQKNSYARLNINITLFGYLMHKYRVFERFWDFVAPFSVKSRESDIGHAPFRFHQSEPVVLESLMTDVKLGSFECAYGFRYVELNNRTTQVEEDPDYDPWSVRQTTVYQQYDSAHDRNVFFLICPSQRVKQALKVALTRRAESNVPLNAFEMHRIVLCTLHDNWRAYLRSVEKELANLSDKVTLTQVRSESERLSPLMDFTVNFIDRQKLKLIEDKILDLQIIFESLQNTVAKMQRQCKVHCMAERCKRCTCSSIVEELEEQRHEIDVNLKKSETLLKRAQGTAHLLSDLLDYENAQIAHHNEVSLNKLVQESKDENSRMRLLTERSARDAAAVKILTVITLIYLPMSVVLNFFSTQLVQIDGGRLSVISDSWYFVAASLPLTIITFLTWRFFLSLSVKEGNENETQLSHLNSRWYGFSKAFSKTANRWSRPWVRESNRNETFSQRTSSVRMPEFAGV